MRGKVVFIGFSYPHHGEYSGYDRIARHVGYDRVLHTDRMLFFRWFHRLAQRRGPLKIGRYTLCDPLQLFYRSFRVYARWRCAFLRDSVIHFAYPETGVVFHSVPWGKENGYVATLHLPAEDLYRLHPRILGRMQGLDHAILVSEDMYEGISVVLPEVPMTFIPHGVEVSRFRPAAGERDNDILMLGNWLRDFPLAAQVFRALDAAGHGLRVTAVALPENLALLKDLPGVSCREGLSDDQLLDLMQRSRVLFLPLKRLTANNAILEAAACGCRVALALHRPLNPTGYFPGLLETISVRPAEAAEQLASLVAEQDARGNELAAYARAHYAWETVARSTELILKTLKA